MSMLGCSKIGDIFSLFLRASVTVSCIDKSVRLRLGTFPNMPEGWAIVFCDEPNPDVYAEELYLSCVADNNMDIIPYVFAPAKCNIVTGADACSYLKPLADLCKKCGVNCIFINGHFNQHDADKTGRGYILCGEENIYTMDIFRAANDPFLKKLVGVTFRIRRKKDE